MASDPQFSVVDYVLLGITLAISGAIGIFYAIRSRHVQTTGEFLMGSRRMPIIPTTLSLLTSFLSAIAILGYPAEIYTMGTSLVVRFWQFVSPDCLFFRYCSVFDQSVFISTCMNVLSLA